jgi:hypothetical protein
MHSLRIKFTVPALIAVLALASTSLAQSRNRKIGTQFTVTADPLVPRPAEKPCTVQLFSGYSFAMFSESVQNFQYTPPADCPGPWAAVVIEADFSENAGAQFDRTASLYLNNTELYFGTTPEPLATDTNTWHVERDITDYSSLLSAPEPGSMVLPNCTSDCPPPYQYLNGIFTVSADIQFYPLQGSGPARPDVVMPLLQSNGNGGYNLPASLTSPTQQLSTTFTLPTNIEQAYLDVVSQGQSGDEFWYTCVPNDLTTELQSCGGTAFRETEISIDGTAAGVAPVYPWIFTGGIDPFLWVPIPGVQTLDLMPYRVNLTPFAGLLSDGQPHTVALNVLNITSDFSATANLLLYEDHGSQQVSGAVTKNTIQPPNPIITTDLQVNGSNVIGTVKTVSERQFVLSGYVNTSHGKVVTTIQQSVNFSNFQGFKIKPNIYVQDISQLTPVNTDVIQKGSNSTFSSESLQYPLNVGITATFPNGQTLETTIVQQEYEDNVATPQYTSTVSNLVSSKDTLNFNTGVHYGAGSSQQYTLSNSLGQSYSCGLATKNNTLQAVSSGCSQIIPFK